MAVFITVLIRQTWGSWIHSTSSKFFFIMTHFNINLYTRIGGGWDGVVGTVMCWTIQASNPNGDGFSLAA